LVFCIYDNLLGDFDDINYEYLRNAGGADLEMAQNIEAASARALRHVSGPQKTTCNRQAVHGLQC
jgi:hypothetical protein